GIDMIGTGPEADRLKSLAESLGADARFLGFLTGEDLEHAIAAARAVVVPSEWYENAPLSVLEAFALGKPVVSSRPGGLPESVVDGATGWTFTAGATDELAALLRRIRDLPDGAVRCVGERARDRVVSEFSPQRYREAVGSIYASLGVRGH